VISLYILIRLVHSINL